MPSSAFFPYFRVIGRAQLACDQNDARGPTSVVQQQERAFVSQKNANR
jgi:hypothetical protein